MKPVDEYLSKISSALKEKFKEINFIVFDFDGVFTDNNVQEDRRLAGSNDEGF